MDEICGCIEHIVYADPNRGFTVARLQEPKKPSLTVIVGVLPTLQPGETMRCQGHWKHHPQHGLQFEVLSYDAQAPSDLVGMQKYLESGMVKGVGPKFAARIVKQFGLETLRVIDEAPQRLLEVSGIGEKKRDKILQCWQEQKAIRDVIIFLRKYEISPSFAQKIYKTYGPQSIDKVKSNPYALAREVHGIGFKSADRIAKGLGIENTSWMRIEAGIEHVLWELSSSGHVCFPEKELSTVASEILELPVDAILERMEHMVAHKALYRQQERIWLKPLYFSELGIAKEIARLMQSPCDTRSIEVTKAIEWAQQRLHIQFAPEQKSAIELGLIKKFLIITGGPGTGKSTITRALIAIAEQVTPKILLAAPTGRAAKRLGEITGKTALTIHALLAQDFQKGGFKHCRDNPLKCNLLIIDEASMIDTLLMHHLLKAIPSHARAIFIGDVDQLPSVGPGNVLKDMILSQALAVITLKQIFRQAKHSQIVMNAHRINEGCVPDITNRSKGDFFFLHAEAPEEILATIVGLVKDRLPSRYSFDRFQEIQVLSPMKRGLIGTENLNVALQEALNPSPTPLLRMGRRFHLGDKVMQIRNNYQKEVYNGDVGKILEIDLEEQLLRVLYDGQTVEYEFCELDELVLAYAVSIHKYQGSECPCILIPIHLSHYKLLYRNLLYTGVTRGKRLVILVGSKRALYVAVKNGETSKRFTGLEDRIRDTAQVAEIFRAVAPKN